MSLKRKGKRYKYIYGQQIVRVQEKLICARLQLEGPSNAEKFKPADKRTIGI